MLITFLITFTRGRIHFLSKKSRQWFDAMSAEYSSSSEGWTGVRVTEKKGVTLRCHLQQDKTVKLDSNTTE